jgi:hypothetical protein
MFGLFQADLPIADRIWLTILALLAGGSIASSPLSKYIDDPISFGENLLLLFGQASLISIFILLLPISIIMILENEFKKKVDATREELLVKIEHFNPFHDRLMSFLSVAGYVAAIFWIKNDNYSPGIGAFGLALMLMAEVVTEWSNIYMHGYEYLELRKAKNNIEALIIKEENESKFKTKMNWTRIHAFLGDNNWELLEFSESFSLNRRKYKKGIIPQKWQRSLHYTTLLEFKAIHQKARTEEGKSQKNAS